MDPFPHFQAMNGHIRVHVETQFHFSILDREHGYFQYALEAIRSADHNRLLVLSG
jgi:hypothetical protein